MSLLRLGLLTEKEDRSYTISPSLLLMIMVQFGSQPYPVESFDDLHYGVEEIVSRFIHTRLMVHSQCKSFRFNEGGG